MGKQGVRASPADAGRATHEPSPDGLGHTVSVPDVWLRDPDESPLDYRSQSDMMELAFALQDVPDAFGPMTCAFIVDNDLMRPQWWMRFGLWIMRKRMGHTLLFWEQMEQKDPGSFRQLINGTVTWIRHGRDRTTRDAAGGFNRKEAKLMHHYLYIMSQEWRAANHTLPNTPDTQSC